MRFQRCDDDDFNNHLAGRPRVTDTAPNVTNFARSSCRSLQRSHHHGVRLSERGTNCWAKLLSVHRPETVRFLLFCSRKFILNLAMDFVVGLLMLMFLGSAESSVGPSNSSSSFCTESKECLQFDLVCKTDEYEVRHYSPTRWVSTDAEAYFMGVGAAMAFRRLFQYITGANEAGVKIEMTAPVLVRIPEETKMWEPAIYTLSFLLPSAYQDNPPAPTNDKLYFTDMPDMDVYVRSYGGWMLSVTSRLHAHLLTKELQRAQASYNHTYHYGVGYDSPLKLLNRHNEVWYVAEEEPVCVVPTATPAETHTP